jgi:gliding motility-associated-like protein
LFILLGFALKVHAQDLPVACTQSWQRYAPTPDSHFTNSHFNWVFKGGTLVTKLYGAGDSIDVQWSDMPGKYRIGVQEISSSGCEGDTVWEFVDVKGSVLNIGDRLEEMCQGDSKTFDAGPGFVSYLWNGNDTLNKESFNYLAQKNDTIYVVAYNVNNCRNTDTVIMTVHPRPKAYITVNGDSLKTKYEMMCGNQTALLDAGNDGLFYKWNTGELSTSVVADALLPTSPDSIKLYKVEVTSQYGCTAVDSFTIRRCVPPAHNKMNNVFTPNGDNQNDTWKIDYLEFYPNATVDVYDRWGRLVFHSDKGYSKPWDGTSNGVACPMDTYFYIIKLDNNSKPFAGNVTIIR